MDLEREGTHGTGQRTLGGRELLVVLDLPAKACNDDLLGVLAGLVHPPSFGLGGLPGYRQRECSGTRRKEPTFLETSGLALARWLRMLFLICEPKKDQRGLG